ncbi:MAG: flagellar assembly protein FliW [Acidimicrobiales bacterium]
MSTRVVPTVRFGELDVDDDEIIDFADGLLGFATLDQAVLVPVDEDGLFFWLQAVNDPELAFLVVTPWPLFPEYQVDLDEPDQAALELADTTDASVLCVVTSHDQPRRFTVNLLGPLVVNQRLRRGRQILLGADLPTQAELPAIP